ncbi:MAG TPA: amino acid ABC transporter permease [Nocardioides sp.]|uniref:amino acid ABC transporter permease n=1 Tax=uncultured Nocardioides sp. TaxID=198441 RepID=UPI002618598C|nr:amino acid ABC transporter permease [uncultured Nocardioides sp.]HRI94301.1 amino acid ABC transporter permease [Nocardioides sp.]HRK44247.1 amino acid ABC transporter permease [Nocardioides sp.]
MNVLIDVATDLRDYLPELLGGLRLSVILTLSSLVLGLPIALALAFGVTAAHDVLRWACVAVVEFGRGAPVLVVLQLAYFGLPDAGVTLSAQVAATAALTLMSAAYLAEYLRGGIAAVPPGEVEGCLALGMSRRDTLRYVTVPQGVRIALPSMMGFSVMLFQATSLAYSVAVPELMSRAYSIGSSNFRYLSMFIAAGLLYAVIAIPCTWASVYLEKLLNRHA